MTNAEGQLVWQGTVLPSGEVVASTIEDAPSGRTVVTNLRLPGQYDERLFAAAGLTGLQGPYNNWNRWYLPGVGRYLEPDPLALAGGFNGEFGPDWYGYANQNPMSYSDPWGLTTYMCTAPLHALSGGKGAKSGPNWRVNPLYHQFLCVNKDLCGGQDRSGKSPRWELGSPGKPSDDKFNDKTCKPVAPDNKCLENCIAQRITNPTRPYYSIGPLGTDCQEWADDTFATCQAECKGK